MNQHNRNITIGDQGRNQSTSSHYNPFIYYPVSGRMKINFGKHKGKFIDDVSKSYLIWCEKNVKYIKDIARHHLQIYLGLKKEKKKLHLVGNVMPYGKYKGSPVQEVMRDDPRYYTWFKKDLKSRNKKAKK